MKIKIIKPSLTLIAFVFIFSNGYSQAKVGGNGGSTGSEFLGWNTSYSKPLDIKDENNQLIGFYTNAGAGSLSNQQIIIASGGNVGTGPTSPASLLYFIILATSNL